MNLQEMLINLWHSTGLYASTWQNYVMIAIALVLLYLAIGKKYEPLLLLPISFGMLMINIPGAADVLYYQGYTGDTHGYMEKLAEQIIATNASNGITVTAEQAALYAQQQFDGLQKGLFYYLYQGVDKVIFPPLIFLGIGAMTDFGPLIASPKSLIIGAGAQLGIFVTFFGAILLGFSGVAAAAIAIIGGADGPTAIFLTQMLGNPDNLLPTIAIAAYSYMALIPVIPRPFMKRLTTKKERLIKMEQLRVVTKREKIMFPIIVAIIVALILPQALPLIGMLMLGNLLKESMVTERLAKTASNELINIVTIMLGITVGSKALGSTFLTPMTLGVIVLGVVAFSIGTVGGILTAKFMNLFLKKKINPLIGSAGVSAVPMAARVSNKVGQEDDPQNFLLMHAMGPNVAGVIGSAVAAGILLAFFG